MSAAAHENQKQSCEAVIFPINSYTPTPTTRFFRPETTQPRHIDIGFKRQIITIGNLWSTATALGLAAVYVYMWGRWPTLGASSGKEKRDTVDKNPIRNNTNEDNMVSRRVEKRKSKQSQQASDGAQERMKGDKEQDVDRPETSQEMTGRLDNHDEEIATLKDMQQEGLARTAWLEEEVKRLRQTLASQRTEQQVTEPGPSSDEAQTLRDELKTLQDESKQREQDQKKRLVEKEKKHQGEITKRDKELTTLKEDNERLRKQLKEEKEKCAKLQPQAWRNGAVGYDTMVARAGQLEREKASAVETAKAMTDKFVKLTTQHMELQKKFDVAKNLYESTKQDHIQVVGDWQRKLDKATSQHQHAQTLLAQRSAELKGAQAFLSTADQFSGAELIKDLEQLNSEIMQLAASAAEEVVAKERAMGGRADEGARNALGHRLAELLTNPTFHDIHQIVIQAAFQTALVAHVQWILSAWFFNAQQNEAMMGNLHESIRKSEAQAVAGRWRQLTRNHLQALLPRNLEDLHQGMMSAMAAIVVLAGYSLENVGPGMQRFGNRVNTIVKLAHNLNKKAGEGVTSSDLQFVIVKSDTPYNPTEMTPTVGTGQPLKNARELIICTTDLGLVRSEKPPEANAPFKTTVLLKPKVILYSEFEGAGHGMNAN